MAETFFGKKMNPFVDVHVWKNLRIRMFNSVQEDELIWHTDKKDRLCVVLYGDGWKFQLDNELPISISTGDHFTIEKGVYHRLLRGSTNLILVIKEFGDEYSNENREHSNEIHGKANSKIYSLS